LVRQYLDVLSRYPYEHVIEFNGGRGTDGFRSLCFFLPPARFVGSQASELMVPALLKAVITVNKSIGYSVMFLCSALQYPEVSAPLAMALGLCATRIDCHKL